MANLTPKQWANKLDSKLKGLEDGMLLAISGVLSSYVPRIFERGLNSAGREIGQYSTNPAVISSENSPVQFENDTFAPFKKGKKSSKGKKGYYGKYFSGGYKEFKGFIGRGTRVNLRLNDELKGDMSSPNFTGNLKKVSSGYNYVVKKDINANKIVWLTDHFVNPIFDLSRTEHKLYAKNVKFEMLRILNK